jgi:excisionase family DNA binding protein
VIPEEDSDRLLTTDDLEDRWQVCARTIKRLVDRKELPCIRIGKQLRFKLSDVLAFEKKWRS